MLGRPVDLKTVFNERKLNWTTRRFPATWGMHFWVKISKFRKKFDKFPPHTHQGAWQIRTVFYALKVISLAKLNSYRNSVFLEILGKIFLNPQYWKTASLFIRLHQAVAGPSTAYIAKRFTWSHPCLCALCCVTAVTHWKISCSWVRSICGTETDTRQVLGSTNRDSKAYSVPFEAEL